MTQMSAQHTFFVFLVLLIVLSSAKYNIVTHACCNFEKSNPVSFFISLHLQTALLSHIFKQKATKNSEGKSKLFQGTFHIFGHAFFVPCNELQIGTLQE